MLGQARGEILRRKKAGEVRPDDFAGLIAEQSLSARIPAQHAAVEAHQEQCVFFRVGGQQIKPLAQLLSRKATGDFRVPWASPFEGLNGEYRERSSQRVREVVTFSQQCGRQEQLASEAMAALSRPAHLRSVSHRGFNGQS